jgi:DNA-binding NtrC family response regulator
VADIESALVSLRGGQGADIIMADAGMDIAKLISALQSERFNLPVVACGVNSDSQMAVRAIKSGAKEYIPLPPDEELIAAVLTAVTEESAELIYQSPAMQQVIQMANQVAPSDASILITGESGTGKEVLARYLFRKSKRGKQPFISVNCAAIPETLLESELFGYEKGAFTGAVARRIGKFEEANNGTLLLDEISEMDTRLQAKLLRAIQEQEIDRIGGNKPVKVNIRILATSNRNLQQEVKQGRFREDLYFRLNVINLQIPPLRDRKEDIVPIATHFADKYAKSNGVPVRPLTQPTLSKLQSYGWPGNVRELENIMHRAVLVSTGDAIDENAILLPQDSAANAQPQAAKSGELVGRTVADVERELILNTLDYCLGNRTHAANILGISIRTLRNKLKEYSEGQTQKFGT